LAMRRAVGRAASRVSYPVSGNRKPIQNIKYKILNTRAIVLVDGPYKIPGLNVQQMPIVKGDRTVFAIACASVIAKVFRDRMMERYAKKFPGYGFEIHKGYGTKLHHAQLIARGASPIHRHSFAPVAKLT